MIDVKILKDYVPQSEAMKILGITYYELQRLKRDGKLEVYDSGGIPVYVSKASIQRVMDLRPKKPERL